MTKKELEQKLNDSYEIINTALDANAELVHIIKELKKKNKDVLDLIDTRIAHTSSVTGAMELIDLKEDIEKMKK